MAVGSLTGGSTSRQRRSSFSGESRKTGEFGKSNICFPNSCSIRRSKWFRALPGWQVAPDKPLRATLYEPDGFTEYFQAKGRDMTVLRPKRAYKLLTRHSEVGGTEIYDGENYPSFPIVPLRNNRRCLSELAGKRNTIDAPGSARFHWLPPRPHESVGHRSEPPDSSWSKDSRHCPTRTTNLSVAFGDTSPFRRERPDCAPASPEKGGICKANGGGSGAEVGDCNLWFLNSSPKRVEAGGRRLSLPTGNAGMSFPENSGKPEKPAASIYGGWFRVLSGGSKWQSALPTQYEELMRRRAADEAARTAPEPPEEPLNEPVIEDE